MSFHLLWSLFRAGEDLEAVHETTGERASHSTPYFPRTTILSPSEPEPLTMYFLVVALRLFADRDPTRLVGVRARSDGSGPRALLSLLSVGRNLLSQGPHHAQDSRLCRESTRARTREKNALLRAKNLVLKPHFTFEQNLRAVSELPAFPLSEARRASLAARGQLYTLVGRRELDESDLLYFGDSCASSTVCGTSSCRVRRVLFHSCLFRSVRLQNPLLSRENSSS